MPLRAVDDSGRARTGRESLIGNAHIRRLTRGERSLALLFAIVPLAMTVIASFQPVFFGPPPDRLLMLPGLAWGLLGVILVWRAQSRAVVPVALVIFTFPAVIAMLFAPGIALILQNLG